MPRLLNAVLLIVALVAVATASSNARAQGTFGALPDPISSNDLEDYAKRLALSDQQLLAISEHHRQYLELFRQLREGEINDLLEQMQTIRRRFDPTHIGEIVPVLKSLSNLMRRIGTLDEQFFSQMQTVLTEEQVERMPRIRQQRERARYGSEITRIIDFLNPGVRVDLTQLIDRLDLADEDLAQIDPVMIGYESQLTSDARKLFDTTINAVIRGVGELESMGFTPDAMQDRQQVMELFQAAQTVWDEVTVDVQKEAAALSRLNRQTFRTLAQLLPHSAARELRAQYFRSAYPEAARIGRAMEQQFNRALSVETLPEEKREAIEALAQSHLSMQDQRADRIADLLDGLRESVSLRDLVRRNRNEDREDIREIRERADQADQEAIASLHTILGEDFLAKMTGKDEAAEVGEQQVVMRTTGPDGTTRTVITRTEGGGGIQLQDAGNGLIPPPILPEDIEYYAALLKLDEDQRVILDSLYDSYRDRFLDTREEHTALIRAATDSTRDQADDDDPRSRFAHREAIDAARDAALDAIRAVDAAFFDDIALAVLTTDGGDAMQRIRDARERSAYLRSMTRGANVRFRGGPGGGRVRMGSGLGAIDLSAIARELNLHLEAPEAFDQTLRRYETDLTPLLRQQYEADRAIRKAMSELRMADGEVEDRRDRFRAMREVIERMGDRSREARQAIESLNQGTIDTLIDALDAEHARQYRHTYLRQAYPDIFNDDDAAGPQFVAALELASLTPSQRTRLREAQLAYQQQYQALSQQMVDTHDRELQAEEDPDDRRAARIARDSARAELERLEFERREINERALLQLRAILSDAQQAELNGLRPESAPVGE